MEFQEGRVVLRPKAMDLCVIINTLDSGDTLREQFVAEIDRICSYLDYMKTSIQEIEECENQKLVESHFRAANAAVS